MKFQIVGLEVMVIIFQQYHLFLLFDNSQSCFVKFYRSRLFNPNGADGIKINSVQTEYKKVTKETFDFYRKYLSTNRQEFFLRAERKCLDV